MITLASKRYTLLAYAGTLDSRYPTGGGPALIDYTFDAGANGANVTELTNDSGTVYDDTQYYGASGKSAKIQITSGSGGFGAWGGIYTFASPLQRYSEVWIRIRCRFPTGFDWTNSDGNPSWIKFLRLRNETIGLNDNLGYNDLYFGHTTTNGAFPNQLRYIHEAEQSWLATAGGAVTVSPDTWHTYEVYYKLDSVRGSAGGQSMLRVWFDGGLVLSSNDRITLAASDAEIPDIYLFTFWNQVAPATQHGWIDDLTVYTSTPPNTDSGGNRFIGT